MLITLIRDMPQMGRKAFSGQKRYAGTVYAVRSLPYVKDSISQNAVLW